MKGKILDFSIPESQGVISGDDGNRYTFVGKEWKSSTPPHPGLRVDYESEGHAALAVYPDQTISATKGHAGNFYILPYKGFYRSGDDKMFAGVCAGLAHKWNFGRAGLRFATAFATLLLGFPLLIYILLWILFPERPTKSVG